jgi:hypothetical protein
MAENESIKRGRKLQNNAESIAATVHNIEQGIEKQQYTPTPAELVQISQNLASQLTSLSGQIKGTSHIACMPLNVRPPAELYQKDPDFYGHMEYIVPNVLQTQRVPDLELEEKAILSSHPLAKKDGLLAIRDDHNKAVVRASNSFQQLRRMHQPASLQAPIPQSSQNMNTAFAYILYGAELPETLQ